MSNLAAIEIPCYFGVKSGASNFSQNNMGSLWQLLNWTLIDHYNVTFLIGEDPYEDNLKRKSIFFAVLLKLNFGLPGRSTITKYLQRIFKEISKYLYFESTWWDLWCTVNQLNFAARKFCGFCPFWAIHVIGNFPYTCIILFNWYATAKFAKLKLSRNLVDLQYTRV